MKVVFSRYVIRNIKLVFSLPQRKIKRFENPVVSISKQNQSLFFCFRQAIKVCDGYLLLRLEVFYYSLPWSIHCAMMSGSGCCNLGEGGWRGFIKDRRSRNVNATLIFITFKCCNENNAPPPPHPFCLKESRRGSGLKFKARIMSLIKNNTRRSHHQQCRRCHHHHYKIDQTENRDPHSQNTKQSFKSFPGEHKWCSKEHMCYLQKQTVTKCL